MHSATPVAQRASSFLPFTTGTGGYSSVWVGSWVTFASWSQVFWSMYPSWGMPLDFWNFFTADRVMVPNSLSR